MREWAEALLRGYQLHQAGDLAGAERIYRQVLETDPDNLETLSLLGAACLVGGKLEQAVASLERVLRLRPDHVPALENLGIALARLNRSEEAEGNIREALRLQPNHAETHLNLAAVLLRQGKLDLAADCYRQALHLQPNHATACLALGGVLMRQGKLEEAADCYREALRHQPQSLKALIRLGEVCSRQRKFAEAAACYRQALRLEPEQAEVLINLGSVLIEMGRADEAVAPLRQAVQLRPQAVEASLNLGLAMLGLERLDEAAAAFGEALRVQPQSAAALSNLGVVYARRDELAEAVTYYRKALQQQPDHAETWNNLGVAEVRLGQHADALTSFQTAIRLEAEYAEAHGNLAMLLLQLGRLERGWREYEWRWRCKTFAANARTFPQPLWDGTPLHGQTILLHTEQGLGDVLQFIRYVPLVQERGGTIVLEAPASLHRLLESGAGVKQLVAAGGRLPPFDVHSPLLSLPGILGTTLATIPAKVPYLRAEPERVDRWRRELTSVHGIRIGIVWQGNPKNPYDQRRSMRLELFAPLANLGDVRLVSLQKGVAVEALAGPGGSTPILEFASRLDETQHAFLETAALMRNLDLVITVDTATAHLAGALAVPVWIALPFAAEWRWFLEREDSPWYPTARLFRQPRPGDWPTVVKRMTSALKETLAARTQPKVVAVEVSPGELLDKITILEIKRQRITDPTKLRHVELELAALNAARQRQLEMSPELTALTDKLRAINERLWQIEDDIRLCERRGDFGEAFIGLARSVYQTNDQRAALKREINALLGSAFFEEKAYRADAPL